MKVSLANILLLLTTLFTIISNIKADRSEQLVKEDGNGNLKLDFVFELIRHGARTPQLDDDKDLFTMPPGMLT